MSHNTTSSSLMFWKPLVSVWSGKFLGFERPSTSEFVGYREDGHGAP